MSFVGLIPARGGSKRLPRKNIRDFCGKPLIAWSIEAALKSDLDAVIVSTDDREIAGIASSYGADIPELRPAGLSNDSAAMLPVLQFHAAMLKQTKDDIEAIVLLQPTSPLRTYKHINKALSSYKKKDAPSLVSVTAATGDKNPDKLLAINAAGEVRNPGFQTDSKLVVRNGPAIIINTLDTLESGHLYHERTLGFHMSRTVSYDIDDLEDFLVAEFVMKQIQAGILDGS